MSRHLLNPIKNSGKRNGSKVKMAAADTSNSGESPTTDPLRRISTNITSHPTVKQANAKKPLSVKLPETAEEFGEMMGLAALEVLKTEEERVIAGNLFMEIVTGSFVGQP
jgi:transcriptional regulator of NAD metabolism